MKLEDVLMFAIRNKETGEMWGDAYWSIAGAKNSFRHSQQAAFINNNWSLRRFDDQDKYEIVKVKLVVVDE